MKVRFAISEIADENDTVREQKRARVVDPYKVSVTVIERAILFTREREDTLNDYSDSTRDATSILVSYGIGA